MLDVLLCEKSERECLVRRLYWYVATCLAVSFAAAGPAHAQLNTQHIKGAVGLKGGSQPPPHWYVVGPLIYTYNTDTVRQRDGERFPVDADITTVLYGAGVSKVTTQKILGGFYGFSVLFAGVNNRIQGTDIDLNPGGGLTDTAVQPITSAGTSRGRMSWRATPSTFRPVDTPTAPPTTSVSACGDRSRPSAQRSTSTRRGSITRPPSPALTFQSEKEDSDTKVGTAMNLEGGVGGDFLKGGLTAGLVYYASFKLEEDRIDGIPSILIRGKNKVFAFGPEVSLALARKGVLYRLPEGELSVGGLRADEHAG